MKKVLILLFALFFLISCSQNISHKTINIEIPEHPWEENSSGKHKGQSSISKRGRKNLRKILFQAVLPLIRSNDEFREVYSYYTTRQKNPLKGKQAAVAVGCKLIRVFYAILTHGVDYDANRLRTDIIRPQEQQAA